MAVDHTSTKTTSTAIDITLLAMLERLHFGDEAPEGRLARRPSKLMRPNRQRRFGLKRPQCSTLP